MLVKDERSSVMDGRFKGLALVAGVSMLFAGVAFTHSPVGAATLPKPTHTNKSRFRIPFKFDSSALQRMNAREIQLHVSRDHGATWELAQTLTPDGGKFEYNSPGDGEYWFSVKTLDGRNQLHPQRGSYETGLIVVVDSTVPSLDLSVKQLSPGQVQITWAATDSNLDASTLRFEYQNPSSREWEAVSVVPRTSGEHSWSINQTGILAVRGTVADFAGNVGQSTGQVNLTAAGALNEKPRPTRRGPIAMPDDGTGSSEPETRSASAPADRDVAEQDEMPIITPRGSLPRYSPSSQRLVSNTRSTQPQERWPASAADSPQVANASLDSARIVPAPQDSISLPSQEFIQAPLPPVPQSQPQFHAPIQAQPQSQSLAVNQAPPVRRNGSRERVVATRRFQIGYKLDDIGPSGIGGVELFITEDNGRVWWKYGDDADQKSPFDVDVPRDGVYGFAIRVRSGAGLSNDPPIPGESPAIVISVDQTAPVVEMLPIQQGQGVNANRLQIRWRVAEAHPSEKPVSLYYAANLTGPWEPISGWKEDQNGTFEWTVGPGVPSQFYVRVMARDAAGNVGKADSPSPIVVDLQRPSARIVDVEVSPGVGPQ
jgi:hypothetical protein